jgi:hypothetical protein
MRSNIAWLPVISALAFSGCVRYVVPMETHHKFQSVLIQFDRFLVLSGPFFEKNERQRRDGAMKNPQLREAYQEMRRTMTEIQACKDALVHVQGALDALGAKRKQITSEDPEWPRVVALHEEYQRIGDRADRAVRQLDSATEAYIRTASAPGY